MLRELGLRYTRPTSEHFSNNSMLFIYEHTTKLIQLQNYDLVKVLIQLGNNITINLTSSHRMPYKPVSVYTHIPIFVCFAGRLVNMPRVTCHYGD